MTSHSYQGRIQDLKKEGAQWLQGVTPSTFSASLGDFLKNLGQKGVGVRPPSGSNVGLTDLEISWISQVDHHKSRKIQDWSQRVQ